MDDLLKIIEVRMYLYNLLRRVYAAGPTMDLIRNLANCRLEFISDADPISGGLEMVASACRKVRDEKDIENLHVEFARLFLFGKMPDLLTNLYITVREDF
ncbi:MAG: hypothetical protein ACK4Z9_05005 [Thermodesulfovibrionales bacterium]